MAIKILLNWLLIYNNFFVYNYSHESVHWIGVGFGAHFGVLFSNNSTFLYRFIQNCHLVTVEQLGKRVKTCLWSSAMSPRRNQSDSDLDSYEVKRINAWNLRSVRLPCVFHHFHYFMPVSHQRHGNTK